MCLFHLKAPSCASEPQNNKCRQTTGAWSVPRSRETANENTALPVIKQPIRHSVTENRCLMIPAEHSRRRPLRPHPQRRSSEGRSEKPVRTHPSIRTQMNSPFLFLPVSPPSRLPFSTGSWSSFFLFPLSVLWGWERPQLKQSHVINCGSWREAPTLRRERYSATAFLRESIKPLNQTLFQWLILIMTN